MVSLSEGERARIRHHLGYLNIEPVASIALGFPSAQQAQFLVESAMNRIIPDAVSGIQRALNALDAIENQMIDGLKRLKAQQLGELKLRNDNNEPHEQDLLEQEYYRWAKRLADDLGVPLNPYSERFRVAAFSPNVPVITGV